ncbi:MAG TPA: beta-eliminating lyase-related protein [Rhizomicrobium sp.]
MNFLSDNAYGAAPQMLEALAAANGGVAAPYGADPITERLRAEMARVFERDVGVFPVATGTAANALALATLVPQHGAIFCHRDAHISVDECGAPEFFTHGAKMVTLGGAHAKLTADRLEDAVTPFQKGIVHHAQPAAVSLTQATELGTCYRPEEIAALAATARKHGMKVHLDGARFANAVAHLGCTPAELTWRAGVDALSFGATKNGAFGAEAVVFFNAADARDFEYRRKKAGHLVSKMRFVSAQLLASLEDRRWLRWAGRANAQAARLARTLEDSGAEIAHPVESNAIFVSFPDAVVAKLRAGGAHFYDWGTPTHGRTLVRLVVSFATPDDNIDRFIALVRR